MPLYTLLPPSLCKNNRSPTVFTICWHLLKSKIKHQTLSHTTSILCKNYLVAFPSNFYFSCILCHLSFNILLCLLQKIWSRETNPTSAFPTRHFTTKQRLRNFTRRYKRANLSNLLYWIVCLLMHTCFSWDRVNILQSSLHGAVLDIWRK